MVAHRAGDRPRDVEHARRVRVATVERAVPRALGREPDQLGQVLGGRRMEASFASICKHDELSSVEHSLDEVPLPRERRARPVDRPRADYRRP